MIKTANLFVVFSEYDRDLEAGTSWFIKRFDFKKLDYYATNLPRISEVCEFFSHEECNLIYDSKNLNFFLHPYEALDNEYPNVSTLAYSIVSHMENWRDNPSQNKGEVLKMSGTDLSNDILGEVACRQHLYAKTDVFLLLGRENILCSESVEVDCKRVGEDCIEWSENLEIENFDIKKVFEWLVRNRNIDRKYNHNPKHGEYGKGAFNGASPLKSSIQHAEALLPYAVINNDRSVYVYDQQYGAYLQYMYDNANGYHGFHVDVVEHDVNDVINRINILNDASSTIL